jgi:TetR/AcrR family transcriptional regulator, transcriptional repressor for nem operon
MTTGRPRMFDADEVIDGARDLFWRRGYGATSMRDLSDHLGVHPGSLYSAFGDKHAIFIQALDRYAESTREGAAVVREGSPLERLREMLLGVLAAAMAAPGRGCMLGNTAAEMLPEDAGAGDVVRNALGELESGIEQALSEAQKSGDVAPDVDCGAQARLLVALMQGLHVLARVEPDPRRLEDAVDAALAPLQG